MSEIKPLAWQQDVAELVKEKQVVLVSSGRAVGASWLGAYLLLQESKAGHASYGLTPRWEMQFLGERLHDMLGDDPLSAAIASKNGKVFTFFPSEREDIILSSQSNPFMALGRSAAGYLPLTVIDTCTNQFDPKAIIQLIECQMRVVVLGQRRRLSWRSSYFDLWFAQAWSEALFNDTWATYQASFTPEDNPYLTPHAIELIQGNFEENP